MMTLIKNGVMATVDLDRNDSENTGAVPLPFFPPILSQISRRFDRRWVRQPNAQLNRSSCILRKFRIKYRKHFQI